MELPTYWDIVQGELIRVLELMVARIAKDPCNCITLDLILLMLHRRVLGKAEKVGL